MRWWPLPYKGPGFLPNVYLDVRTVSPAFEGVVDCERTLKAKLLDVRQAAQLRKPPVFKLGRGFFDMRVS